MIYDHMFTRSHIIQPYAQMWHYIICIIIINICTSVALFTDNGASSSSDSSTSDSSISSCFLAQSSFVRTNTSCNSSYSKTHVSEHCIALKHLYSYEQVHGKKYRTEKSKKAFKSFCYSKSYYVQDYRASYFSMALWKYICQVPLKT